MTCRASGARPRRRSSVTVTGPGFGSPVYVGTASVPETRRTNWSSALVALAVIGGVGGGLGYLMFHVIWAVVWA